MAKHLTLKYSNSKDINLKGNLTGGVNAAIISLPKCIAYGALIFAPLGSDYYVYGVLNGIITYVAMNIITSFIYGNKLLISGPSSLGAIMMASSMVFLVQHFNSMGMTVDESPILFFFLLLMMMVGIFQLAFGLFRIGELTRYIPYPVISGIANGGAILILFSQVPAILGFPSSLDMHDFLTKNYHLVQEINFPLLGIGLVIILIISISKKIITIIPAPLIGIFAGSILFYGLKSSAPSLALGETIGALPLHFGQIISLQRFDGIFSLEVLSQYPVLCQQLAGQAFIIAVVITLNCLLAQSAADSLLFSRSKPSREIVAQGIGNLFSCFLGGFAGNPTYSRTAVNQENGATRSSSKLFSAISMLLILIFFKPLFPFIPKICFTAILIVLAFKRFDPWFFKLFSKIFSNRKYYRKKGLENVGVVLIVIISMVTIGIFQAVAIGILISVITFVMRMGRNIVRREISGQNFCSTMERPQAELDILEKVGSRIRIIELEGSLFFGNTDRLQDIVTRQINEKVEYIILDFGHVNDFDLSGIHIVDVIRKKCDFYGISLILSSIKANSALEEILNKKSIMFPSLEDAFDWAEDQLIKDFVVSETIMEVPLDNFETLTNFTPQELQTINKYLERFEYNPNKTIFYENEIGDSLFFLVKGRADVMKKLPNGDHIRLCTLCPGTIFGEMAIIDGNPRSADVISNTEVVCYKLTKNHLDQLSQEIPALAIKILTGLARKLSYRVRSINAMNTVLR